MVSITGGQLVHRVLEYLTPVDLFFESSACDEAVHNHVHRLSNSECTIHSLRIGSWVPAWINYSQSQRAYHNYILSNQQYHNINAQLHQKAVCTGPYLTLPYLWGG